MAWLQLFVQGFSELKVLRLLETSLRRWGCTFSYLYSFYDSCQ